MDSVMYMEWMQICTLQMEITFFIYQNGTLRVSKESMVLAVGNNSLKANTQSKDEKWCTFLCCGTDGDTTRRHIFDYLMHSPIFHEIDNLKLMDMKVGQEDQTFDYDVKHICKKTRNCIISPKFQIGNIRITKGDLTEFLSLSNSAPLDK